jgi:hypothetical protein
MRKQRFCAPAGRLRACLAVLVLLAAPNAALSPLGAQPPGKEEGAEREAGFTAWEWYQEVRLPDQAAGPLIAVDVPPEVFDKAQPSLNDLRLGDANGGRLPYALRVRRTEMQQQDVPIIRQFNAGPVKAGYYQVTLELQEIGPPGYNEIELDTPGTNYTRKVEAYGADSTDFKDAPNFLHGPDAKTPAFLVHYNTGRGVVDIRRLRFGFQQFRYVQVRVYADGGTKEQAPAIDHVTVRRTIALAGKYRTEPAQLGAREFVRGDGGPGTAWFIDLGAPMPCERLTLQVAGDEVDRPFRLEIADPKAPRVDVGRVEWKWRREGQTSYLDANFPEVVARRLRLVVTDFDNPPLNIAGAKYTSCIREVIFPAPPDKEATPPVRLYYGNPDAIAPHYDLERKLPAELKPPPLEARLGEPQRNPDYVPPPVPLSERYPWLVYVILAAACTCLLAVLALLARQATARADAMPVSR